MRPKVTPRPPCVDGTQAHHTFTDAQLVERCIKEGCTLVIDHKAREKGKPNTIWQEYARKGQAAKQQRG